jgi:hypothetical protein
MSFRTRRLSRRVRNLFFENPGVTLLARSSEIAIQMATARASLPGCRSMAAKLNEPLILKSHSSFECFRLNTCVRMICAFERKSPFHVKHHFQEIHSRSRNCRRADILRICRLAPPVQLSTCRHLHTLPLPRSRRSPTRTAFECSCATPDPSRERSNALRSAPLP